MTFLPFRASSTNTLHWRPSPHQYLKPHGKATCILMDTSRFLNTYMAVTFWNFFTRLTVIEKNFCAGRRGQTKRINSFFRLSKMEWRSYGKRERERERERERKKREMTYLERYVTQTCLIFTPDSEFSIKYTQTFKSFHFV